MRPPTDKFRKTCERMLYAIVLTLVFEGLVRKVVPSAVGLVVFFIKDLLCLTAIYLIAQTKLNSLAGWVQNKWKVLLLIVSPLLLYTAGLDLPLSVFAAKQYLLYVASGLLVPMAFPPERVEEFKRFASLFALLLIPTTIVSILQNSLPETHWLNLSVGGESMGAFASGGYLRVSSTFSFTGQYSWFLNAVCPFMILGFFLPPEDKNKTFLFLKTLLPFLLGVMLTIGAFITGGRTSVVGNASVVVLGFLLSSWKSPAVSIKKGIIVMIFIIPSFIVLRTVKPEFFIAYETRATDSETESHEEQMASRIIGGFVDWTDWFGDQDMVSILIGNGLGVMSNGSDKISTYANSIRSDGFWTEGDVPTTAWEGGVYLLIAWYWFRLSVIIFCCRLWYSIKNFNFSAVSSFLLAYVIINGAAGNLGMQPVVAIWWWISIGSIIAIHGFDGYSIESLPTKVVLNLRPRLRTVY